MKIPSPVSRPLDQRAVAIMILLCACWGSQQVTMKAISSDIPATLQVGLRSLVAAFCVFCFMLVRKEPLRIKDGTMPAGICAGLLFALEFLSVSVGLNYTTASHMSVFLYTSPLFTAVGLHFLVPQERMNSRQWGGIGLAFIGVVVIFADGLFAPIGQGGSVLMGDALGILAGLLWAMTTLVIKSTKLKEASAAKTLLYQLAMTALILLAYAKLSGVNSLGTWSTQAALSMAYQTFIIAFISLLAWFWLLTQYLASRLSVFSFLTPVFGMAFGSVFLHEPLTLHFLLGALMIFGGILMVNRR